jgi:hypothetical protein
MELRDLQAKVLERLQGSYPGASQVLLSKDGAGMLDVVDSSGIRLGMVSEEEVGTLWQEVLQSGTIENR